MESNESAYKEKEIGPIVTHNFPVVSCPLEETKLEKFGWFLYGIFVRPFNSSINYLRQRFINKLYLIDTKLDPGKYYDTDTRMLYGMMSLLVQYIEVEKPLEHINWSDDDSHFIAYYNMIDIYIWWKNYENRKDEICKALDTWYESSKEDKGGGDNWLANINKPASEKSNKLLDKLHKLEQKLVEEETEMIVRLVRIRTFLWT